jgi:predicted HicB family RNase H-like nuclease
MPTARTSANRRYNEKAYDRIEFTVPKGEKTGITAAAHAANMSLNAFIKEAVKEKINRHEIKR